MRLLQPIQQVMQHVSGSQVEVEMWLVCMVFALEGVSLLILSVKGEVLYACRAPAQRH